MLLTSEAHHQAVLMTVDGTQPKSTDKPKPHFWFTSALLPLNVLSRNCGSTTHLPGQCSSSATI
ncbi:hypothetical protein VDT1_1955 [Vibrio sp. 16]|nr:hypothetical protein VDT1_1955 [Vibrio sp. 16]